MRIESDLIFSNRRPGIRRAVLVFLGSMAVMCFAPFAQAQAVLGSGPGVTVTDADVKAAAEAVPLAARKAALSRKDTVMQQVEGVYIRRALAQEAEKEGLDKDPVVAAVLKLARERILSEARLSAIDLAKVPDAKTLEAYAESSYKADPKRFEVAAQTRVRHILVRKEAPDAKAKAEALLARLKGGASFEELAKTESADLTTAAQGGDLGYFTEGSMVKEFETAVAALKQRGDLAGPVETQYGFHLIRFEDRRPAGRRPFSEVADALKMEARGRAQRESRAEKINGLMKPYSPNEAAIEAFNQQYR